MKFLLTLPFVLHISANPYDRRSYAGLSNNNGNHNNLADLLAQNNVKRASTFTPDLTKLNSNELINMINKGFMDRNNKRSVRREMEESVSREKRDEHGNFGNGNWMKGMRFLKRTPEEDLAQYAYGNYDPYSMEYTDAYADPYAMGSSNNQMLSNMNMNLYKRSPPLGARNRLRGYNLRSGFKIDPQMNGVKGFSMPFGVFKRNDDGFNRVDRQMNGDSYYSMPFGVFKRSSEDSHGGMLPESEMMSKKSVESKEHGKSLTKTKVLAPGAGL